MHQFNRAGTQEAQITAVRFVDAEGAVCEEVETGEPLMMEMRYVAHRPIFNPEMGFAIFREDGVQVNGPNNIVGGLPLEKIEGEGILRYHIETLPLIAGQYFVSAAIHDGDKPIMYDYHVQAYPLRVRGGSAERQGIVRLPAYWEHIN